MSESRVAANSIRSTERNFGHIEDSFPVRINQIVAQEIDSIAEKRQIDAEILVNEILERYIIAQSRPKKQNGTDFLLSLAGIFDSGGSNASENVSAIVSDFMLN